MEQADGRNYMCYFDFFSPYAVGASWSTTSTHRSIPGTNAGAECHKGLLRTLSPTSQTLPPLRRACSRSSDYHWNLRHAHCSECLPVYNLLLPWLQVVNSLRPSATPFHP